MGIFQVGVKIKNIWNHHLVTVCQSLSPVTAFRFQSIRWKGKLFWFWQFAKHHCFSWFSGEKPWMQQMILWKTIKPTKTIYIYTTLQLQSYQWYEFHLNSMSSPMSYACMSQQEKPSKSLPIPTPTPPLRLRQRRQHGTWMWHLLNGRKWMKMDPGDPLHTSRES